MVTSDAKSQQNDDVYLLVTKKMLLLTNNNLNKKKKNKLEEDGPVNGDTLIDSMRTSSPTRHRSATAGEDFNHISWNLLHPSALSSFDKIITASEGKQIVVFLDYDGTLSPIVADPDRALLTPHMRDAVKNVAKLFPTAIVSGRSRSKVYDFVGLPELYYAGSHGMDIKGPSVGSKRGNEILCQPAQKFRPLIDQLCKALTEKMEHIPGCKVENNKFCFSVHFRCVDEQRWGEVAGEVKSVIKDHHQLRLSHGRNVLEIRPTVKWDKGNAVEFLLECLGYGRSKINSVLPIYIGDDQTDEDAFRVLRNMGRGVGILVTRTPKETLSSYTLKEPQEVMRFLQLLVDYRTRVSRH